MAWNTHLNLLSSFPGPPHYALIAPLLRALDWDTENPEVVIPEYSVGSRLAEGA